MEKNDNKIEFKVIFSELKRQILGKITEKYVHTCICWWHLEIKDEIQMFKKNNDTGSNIFIYDIGNILPSWLIKGNKW